MTTTITPVPAMIVLDCPDPLVLGAFYAELLGWPLREGSDAEWAELLPPGGGWREGTADGRIALAFQQIDDWVAPTWPGGAHPQQFHLDLIVDDIEAAEPRVLALGGSVHDHQPSDRGTFRVYLDPAGHPFCLCLGDE